MLKLMSDYFIEIKPSKLRRLNYAASYRAKFNNLTPSFSRCVLIMIEILSSPAVSEAAE